VTPKEQARQNIETFLKSLDRKPVKRRDNGKPAKRWWNRRARIDAEIAARVGDIFGRKLRSGSGKSWSPRYAVVVTCDQHPEWGPIPIHEVEARTGVARDRIADAIAGRHAVGGMTFAAPDGTLLHSRVKTDGLRVVASDGREFTSMKAARVAAGVTKHRMDCALRFGRAVGGIFYRFADRPDPFPASIVKSANPTTSDAA
jgi:hypothetical protein